MLVNKLQLFMIVYSALTNVTDTAFTDAFLKSNVVINI